MDYNHVLPPIIPSSIQLTLSRSKNRLNQETPLGRFEVRLVLFSFYANGGGLTTLNVK